MNPITPGAPTTASDLQELLRASQGRWALDPSGSSAEFHAKQFWARSPSTATSSGSRVKAPLLPMARSAA